MTGLYWWFIWLCLGIIAFPLVSKIFSRLWDRGYLVAKLVGLLFSAWPLWLLAHLGILPFTQMTALLVVVLMGAAVFFWAYRRNNLLQFKQVLTIIIVEEVVFLVALTGWSFVRGLSPDIAGLEKFMDFGFVNAILRSRFFPPQDMWFAGESINYYYFGHYLTAFIIKLSGIDSAVGYNLMIATLFAFTFSLVFSFNINLAEKILGRGKLIPLLIIGLISAWLICLGSNWHTFYHVVKDGSQNYWYPDATRYIGYDPPTNDKTIHEFPAYSFIVADLHGHVLDIPLVLSFLLLVANFFFYHPLDKNWRQQLPFLGLLGFWLGIMYMTNSWDLPVYLLVLGMAYLFLPRWQSFGQFLQRVLGSFLVIIITAVLVSLPFSLNFSQIAGGVDLVHSHTPLFQLVILWGGLAVFGISFLIFVWRRKEMTRSDKLVIVFFLTFLILIALPEIIYVKDIYAADYYRANTMFKFTFQAYLLMGLVSGYIAGRIIRSFSQLRQRLLAAMGYLLLFSSLLLYPAFSLPGFYHDLSWRSFEGLDGLNFLAQYPDDYAAVRWMRDNISGQPHIVEAAGDSYTHYNRVSAMTGLPTIQGWVVHEWLWRGSYDKVAARQKEVEVVFQGDDLSVAREILHKHQVRYIFYGSKEREKYPESNKERLSQLGQPVFKSGETVIYEVGSKRSEVGSRK